MEFKCRICAGSLTIDPKTRIAVCDYCGTKQVLPIFGDDSSKILFERGTQYLQHNEYDKAEAIFTQLLSVNPNDGEIYWDIVQCKYGVTYAKDPKTGKYIPTCNRTLTDSILKDEHYLKAIELSSADKAVLYKNDATIIENIQKRILEISRKEKPFDIFISYKESDENGNRTKDSIVAQKLYEKLTELGYKVFFSRVTLESKVGEEYEPYIYAALSSSKVMITVCSSEENIQSAWVKNEWSRFLTLRRNDASKTLIPVYFDMDPTRLPEEFALLAAQDQSAEDFEQELLRGIKKLIPTPIELKEYRKKRNKVLAIAGSVLAVIAIAIGGVYYAKSVKEAKIAAENERLEEEAKAQAAEIEEKYKTAKRLFDEKDYASAKSKLEELGEYKDCEELALKCTYYDEYDAAMQFYYDRDYPEAVWALEKVGDYDDVKESLEKSKRAWRDDLCTVALYVDLSGARRGAYYITANGTVDCFKNMPGNENVEVKAYSNGVITDSSPLSVNAHGKIVSIAANDVLYALYEDGYVCNSAYLNNMATDWTNAIQITDKFNVTSVALLEDGTVVYGDTSPDQNGDSDKWLEEVGTWKDITRLEWSISRYGYGGLMTAYIVGVDSKGESHSVYYNSSEFDNLVATNESERIVYDNETYAVKEKIVLDDDKVLHVYDADGAVLKEIGGVKYYNLNRLGEIIVINSKNEMINISTNTTILEGIVYLKSDYCVTQSGAIYELDGTSTNAKTKVRDVWLEK